MTQANQYYHIFFHTVFINMCTRAFCFFNFLSTMNELITLKIKEILNCRPMMFWSFHYGFFVITRFVYRLFSYLTNINIIKKSVRWFHCTHQCVGGMCDDFWIVFAAPSWCGDACDQRASGLAPTTFFFFFALLNFCACPSFFYYYLFYKK